jgi:thymidine phosphorylase
VDAGLIGRACVTLGAGRAKATDAIDFAVGCDRIRKVGEHIEQGAPFLRIHARDDDSLARALPDLEAACAVQ